MRTNKVQILYYAATLLFVVPQAWSAVQYLSEAPRMVQTFEHLGYPLYFMKLLAVAKLLGIVVLLVGRWPVLKEWAYAGFTFDATGAFVSHLSVGDSILVASVPAAFIAVQLISYFAWKRATGERVIQTEARERAAAKSDVPANLRRRSSAST